MSSTSVPATPRWRRRAMLLSLAVAVILAVLVVARRLDLLPDVGGPTRGEASVPALQANTRGVGRMEQFDFAAATVEFEEAVRLAPGWEPARINLGIALLNTATPETLARAISIFEELLKRRPDSPYAHYCLGVIFKYQNRIDEAAPHFEAVTRIDPRDPGGWYQLGSVLPPGSARAAECYRKAAELDPYLSGALYGLAMSSTELIERAGLLETFEKLKKADWGNPTRTRYGEMGHYAEVIGTTAVRAPADETPVPLFLPDDGETVRLAPGTRWAVDEDLGPGDLGDLRRAVRKRFGGVMAVLDYDRDGKPDLFLVAAVVRDGNVRDLLLHNLGDGTFEDVTAKAGLDGSRPSLGCAVADFDNDGWPDLLVTGAGEQHLFRNTKGVFEDVTKVAGLDLEKGVCVAAAWADIDQDGDLDLVIGEHALSAGAALWRLNRPEQRLEKWNYGSIYLNTGEAPPAAPNQDPPPLTPRFSRTTLPIPPDLSSVSGLLVGDLDNDGDLDVLVFGDGRVPDTILNDRLLRFHWRPLPGVRTPPANWNGGLVLDADNDGRADVLLISPDAKPILLLGAAPPKPGELGFAAGRIVSPPLIQAEAVDLDLDGQVDIVGLSGQRRPVFLRNQAGGLRSVEAALGQDAEWPADLLAVKTGDFAGSGRPDVITWSAANGLRLRRNQGNGNAGLWLLPSGHRRVEGSGSIVRTNADGVGVKVIVQVEDRTVRGERVTASAGPGQSSQPMLLGLGRSRLADLVRFRWPDNCWQAEFGVPAGVHRIEETNRKGESCPLLFAWDGRRFGFVTDFLGEASMGEMLAGGGHRPPRPEESVAIEADQLKPLDGSYVIKVAEPMNELTYLDRLRLVIVDQAPGTLAYPDERFAAGGPAPTQDLLVLGKPVFPAAAKDHGGRDVLPAILDRDRDCVGPVRRRSWLGFAEEHALELDFGDRLAGFTSDQRLVLCLAGWTDYPYPESIWAAGQAGVALQPPSLDGFVGGTWKVLVPDVGFPAGLPRVMTREITGLIPASGRLRLRSNMTVFWDQVFIAPLIQAVPRGTAASRDLVRTTPLEVADARLESRGCVQEISPDGRLPTVYDHDRLEAIPVVRQAGDLTRRGDVTELLRATDDRFVIFGPGDEVTVRFSASGVPALPPGWARKFVLETTGYCKDAAPFTARHETVEPLPFRAMSTYPYPATEHYPDDEAHREYRRRYNTRRVGSGVK